MDHCYGMLVFAPYIFVSGLAGQVAIFILQKIEALFARAIKCVQPQGSYFYPGALHCRRQSHTDPNYFHYNNVASLHFCSKHSIKKRNKILSSATTVVPNVAPLIHA